MTHPTANLVEHVAHCCTGNRMCCLLDDLRSRNGGRVGFVPWNSLHHETNKQSGTTIHRYTAIKARLDPLTLNDYFFIANSTSLKVAFFTTMQRSVSRGRQDARDFPAQVLVATAASSMYNGCRMPLLMSPKRLAHGNSCELETRLQPDTGEDVAFLGNRRRTRRTT